MNNQRGSKKQTVYVTPPEALGSIISWMWTKSVWYGPLFSKWWMEKGAKAFQTYAKKHATEFQKEPDLKLLKELYDTCSRGALGDE